MFRIGRAAGAAAIVASLLLLSCASSPRENLTLDLTGVDTPVMLTPVEPAGKTLTVSFESGYSSMSVTATATAGAGGASSSTTVTASRDIQKPFRDQLMPTLLQDPPWLSVHSLVLNAKKQLGLGWSSREYLLVLELTAPLGN